MLVLNENVYTLEHGMADEDTDIYVDLLRCDGQPHARILFDGQMGKIVTICSRETSLHGDSMREYELANYSTHEDAYLKAVADLLPWTVKAAQVRGLIAGAPDKAVA